MKDFILAALPLVAAGIAAAVVAARLSKQKKGKKDKQEKQDKQDNYSLEGMCLGMSAGVLLGSMGVMDLGLCPSLGMLVGLAVGMCIEKRENDGEQRKEDSKR